jgi:hypothetical protein
MDAAKQDRRGAPQKKPTLARPRLSPRDRGRTFIPMRVVWERMSTIGLGTPASAGSASIRKAEDELAQDENKRANVKKLFALYQLAGDVDRAEQLAKRWSEKEPLDPEALTARADVAARKGDREPTTCKPSAAWLACIAGRARPSRHAASAWPPHR